MYLFIYLLTYYLFIYHSDTDDLTQGPTNAENALSHWTTSPHSPALLNTGNLK